VASPAREELMDMVAGFQVSRMNDQRANLPTFPGLNSGEVINQLLATSAETEVPDDCFFETLMRCQVRVSILKKQIGTERIIVHGVFDVPGC
jgi:hypothetical protein